MVQEKIKCPECGAEFQLSQAISHDIEISAAKKYEKQVREIKEKSQKAIELKEKELKEQFQQDRKRLEEKAKRRAEESLKVELSDAKAQLSEKSIKLEEAQKKELGLLNRQRKLEEKEKSFEFEMTKKLEKKEQQIRKELENERKDIEERARKRTEEMLKTEMADLKEQLREKNKKIQDNQQVELQLRKHQRELEEKERELELQVTRQVDAEKQKIIENTLKDFEEKHHLKDAEKDKQLADMKKKIDELQRQAGQGSQKMQGEVLELELEEALKNEFPFDEIEPVPPGIKGADAIQIVKTQTGKICGKILWETKRTKIWSDSWLQKVKDDKREAKADMAILVSETLPKGLTHFRMIDGVWVVSISTSLSLALAVRLLLIHAARERRLEIGKKGKMELVYNYLTGTEFKNRVEAIVESFIQMKTELDVEKRAMNKIWDKRDKQIERVILNIGGMHGDLEGITGTSLPAIKMLELPSEQEDIEKNGAGEIK